MISFEVDKKLNFDSSKINPSENNCIFKEQIIHNLIKNCKKKLWIKIGIIFDWPI